MNVKAALLAFICACAAARATAAPACPAAQPDAADDIGDLRHLASVLKPRATLEILAVGSATIFGPQAAVNADAAHGPTAAPLLQAAQAGFAWQAAHALEASVRGLHVNVTIIGRRGLTAAGMLPLLRAELPHKPYRLVLWQTGTVEAVDEIAPEDFYQTLADGAAMVAAAGADLVLVDPQYSRFLSANANMQPYQAALQDAATLPGVGLFHRFDLMRDWVANGEIDLERAPKADRAATAVQLHKCLGEELAREMLAQN